MIGDHEADVGRLADSHYLTNIDRNDTSGAGPTRTSPATVKTSGNSMTELEEEIEQRAAKLRGAIETQDNDALREIFGELRSLLLRGGPNVP